MEVGPLLTVVGCRIEGAVVAVFVSSRALVSVGDKGALVLRVGEMVLDVPEVGSWVAVVLPDEGVADEDVEERTHFVLGELVDWAFELLLLSSRFSFFSSPLPDSQSSSSLLAKFLDPLLLLTLL